MPLQLNLLHEEIAEQRQRKRDPLKLAIYIGIAIAALFVLNYLWTGYRVFGLKSQLATVQHDWEKVEPKVTAAQKRAEELNGIINTTRTLDGIMNARFYWAPFLEKIARCVTPNIQLVTLDASADEDSKGAVVALEGMAAGTEPRAVAEDFRQMLLEQMSKEHPAIKVEFKTLDDLETSVPVGGNSASMARFTLGIEFNPFPSPAPAASSERRAHLKKEDK
jgi:hypothetical protein